MGIQLSFQGTEETNEDISGRLSLDTQIWKDEKNEDNQIFTEGEWILYDIGYYLSVYEEDKKEMKIAIVTLHRVYNYGSALQA